MKGSPDLGQADITIFRYDGVALNNETLNMWF